MEAWPSEYNPKQNTYEPVLTAKMQSCYGCIPAGKYEIKIGDYYIGTIEMKLQNIIWNIHLTIQKFTNLMFDQQHETIECNLKGSSHW